MASLNVALSKVDLLRLALSQGMLDQAASSLHLEAMART